MTKPLFSLDKKINVKDPDALGNLITHVSKITDTLARFMRNGVSLEDNLTFYYYEANMIDGIGLVIPPKRPNQILSGAIPIYSSGNSIESYSVNNSNNNSLSVTINFTRAGTTSFVRFLCFSG